jgi:hypothetical protein
VSDDLATQFDRAVAPLRAEFEHLVIPPLPPQRTNEHFAVFAAVEAVLDRHLTSDRWQLSTNPDDADDDAANGWVRPAREAVAQVIETSILLRWNNDPAAAEADFEDFRDHTLWQAMVNLARAEDGVECQWRGCNCDCHDE